MLIYTYVSCTLTNEHAIGALTFYLRDNKSVIALWFEFNWGKKLWCLMGRLVYSWKQGKACNLHQSKLQLQKLNTNDLRLGRLELSGPYSCITSRWPSLGKLMDSETTPIVIMCLVRQHNFNTEGLIWILLLLLVIVKVNSLNLATYHVIW